VRSGFRIAITIAAAGACTNIDDVHRPTLAAITPERASPGTVIELSGDSFCAQPEPDPAEEIDRGGCEHMGAVSFDEVPGTVGEYTDTRIMVEVPRLPPGEVHVRVSVMGRTSNSRQFRVQPPSQ
jgi:hypothetical protein